jgi:hypothetical protein
VTLVVGARGKAFVARLLDRLLRSVYEGVGLVLRDRATIDGCPVDPTSIGRRTGAETLLVDPRAQWVVGTASPKSIRARGLGVDHLDVAVFVGASHERAVRTVLSTSPLKVVMRASDPFAGLVTKTLGPERVILIGRPWDDPLALEHAAAGGRWVHGARNASGRIARLRRGGLAVGALPLPLAAAAEGALLAAGAGFALGLSEASQKSSDRRSA